MKRACCLSFILTILLFIIVLPAQASPSVVLNSQNLTFDVLPIVEDGRTLVPLRAIFEALGAYVNWDETTQLITATKAETTIKLQINTKTAYKNNQAVSLDVPSKIVENRTLVPLRFVSEALGANVEWDNSTQQVIITSPVTTMPVETEGPLNITSGLEFNYDANSHSLVTFVERDKLPLPLQGFDKVSVLSGISKEEIPNEVLNDYFTAKDKSFYLGQSYNTAGYWSVMVDFAAGNCAAFLFDKNDKLIGYHLIKEEELSIHNSPFVDIHITVEPCSIDILKPLDFKVFKLINGEVDPEYTWNGGYSEEDGNKVTLKHFLSGDNVTYKVEPAREEIKIQSVQILPTEW